MPSGSAFLSCRGTVAAAGRLVLAVDVSAWLRPDAEPFRTALSGHTYGCNNANPQATPGWPYSVVVAPETGRTSWAALLDAVRLIPGVDLAATTNQVREVVPQASGPRVIRRS